MNDERLKNLGGGGYSRELLECIRDIRASEAAVEKEFMDMYGEGDTVTSRFSTIRYLPMLTV